MGELEDSILVGFNVTLPNDNFADQGGPSGPGVRLASVLNSFLCTNLSTTHFPLRQIRM